MKLHKRRPKPSKILLISLAAVLVLLFVFTAFTSVPISYLIRLAFLKGPAVAPANYEKLQSTVSVTKDLTYPSRFKDNRADIYTPKKGAAPFPVVLWLHGGAFVGGDKRDATIYATSLAAKGYAVVCVNYRRAPEAKYPTPILQTGEAYLWLSTIASEYSLDMNRFVIAGDSAGAHISAQFAAIQSNDDYAAQVSIKPVVPPGTLKATLLFCGPFDVAEFSEIDNPILSFFLQKSAQAYFGARDWSDRFSVEATIGNHITKNFPPTFISDGNTASFEKHGQNLAIALEKKNVPVETYFVPLKEEVIKHEYQFVMNTPAGEASFEKVLDFLKEYV